MDSMLKNDRHDYYDICMKLLCLCGQSPYQNLGKRMFRMSIIATWNITILLVQAANYFVCETLECILQTLPMNILAFVALVKLLTYHFNRQKIKILVNCLNADWKVLCCEEEFDIMKKYAKTSKLYTFLYTTYVYTACTIFGFTALVPRFLDVVSPLDGNESRPKILPCPAYYFVDETKYFYYIFLHLQVGATLSITGVIAHDCNFFTFVEHVCSLFAIAGFRLEHLIYKHNITQKRQMDPSDEVYFKNIAFAVQAHRRALKYTKLLEDTFCPSFALQMLFVMFSMSVSLIQISAELHGDKAEVVRYFFYTLGQLLHLLILSFEGQQLINHSLETHSKIYNGLWYKISVKSQRMLLFAMRKTIKTSSLTAGKIYIFCLESFTSVMQCSVSYFTLLSSFDEP